MLETLEKIRMGRLGTVTKDVSNIQEVDFAGFSFRFDFAKCTFCYIYDGEFMIGKAVSINCGSDWDWEIKPRRIHLTKLRLAC